MSGWCWAFWFLGFFFFAGVLSIFCVDISSLVSLLSCFLFILFFCMFSCGFVAIFCCFRVVNVFEVCLCFVSFTFFWYRKVVFFLLLCRDVELYLLLFLFISLFFFLMCFLEGFCISFAMVYFFPVCLFCLIVFLDV